MSYKQGQNARIEGAMPRDNPHPPGSQRWKEWSKGWEDEHENYVKQTGEGYRPPAGKKASPGDFAFIRYHKGYIEKR